MTHRTQPEHASDFDRACKEPRREAPPQFLVADFWHVARQIDWSYPPEWLDKEICQIPGEPGIRNQRVDLLMRVRLLTGERCRISVPLKVQASSPRDFAERIALYNPGLFWGFQEPVITLVVPAVWKSSGERSRSRGWPVRSEPGRTSCWTGSTPSLAMIGTGLSNPLSPVGLWIQRPLKTGGMPVRKSEISVGESQRPAEWQRLEG